MLLILRVTIFFCYGIVALAQGYEVPQDQFANDPCGNPAFESMAWTSVEGKVIKVIDGDTIILSLDNKKRLLVHLLGIEAPTLNQPFGREAQRFLERIIGSKKVEVWVNPSNWIFKRPRPRAITGVVYLREADMQDANLSLIRAGMARHKQSQSYTMSNYTECRYEKAEEEAHSAKRGLWQRAA
jgi:micrococcal nuclease